jgi:DNA-binding transcriptional LysR family regulator
MNLKHLQTFLTLTEIKNFTKTAEYLHYAQSNVTTQIQQLEEELNVRLFERIGKSVTLTSAGLELIPYARKMLNLSKDLKLKFSNQNSGRITIGASESNCIYRLPKIIKAFQSEHPSVELYLHVLDTSDFTPLLADNTIDIAFTLDTPISNTDINTALQIDENICAFSTPSHPLAKKQKVFINDFSDSRLVLTGKECCYRKMFERELLAAAVTPKIVLETSSLQVIKQTVLSGLGICILPQLAVQKELDNQELVKINYDMNYNIVSQLIYHKDKWISPNLNSFMDMVKK